MSVCKSYFRFFIISFAFICLINATVPSLGECPADIKPIEDFNVSLYMGKWYFYEAYPRHDFSVGGKCIEVTNVETSNSSVVTVLNSQIGFFGNSESKRSYVTTTIVLSEGPSIGKFCVFDSDKEKSLLGNYVILGIDYSSYVVIYSCSDYYTLLHTTTAWVLTRDRIPSNETLAKAREVIDANNITHFWFMKIDQSNCPPDENANQTSSR